MEYLFSFYEGIKTFVSPCLLPLLAVCLAFFACCEEGKASPRSALLSSLSFAGGFSLFFVLLGVLGATLWLPIISNRTDINVICGVVIFVFGIGCAGILKIDFLGAARAFGEGRVSGFLLCALFGVAFAVAWSPFMSRFLSASLLFTAAEGTTVRRFFMLLSYLVGLDIPFVLSALALECLKGTSEFIKKHYKAVNRVCGALMIAAGMLVMTGLLAKWMNP